MRDEKTAARTFAQLNDKQEELERKKAKLQEELGVQGGRKGEVSSEFLRTSSFSLALAFALFAGFICESISDADADNRVAWRMMGIAGGKGRLVAERVK